MNISLYELTDNFRAIQEAAESMETPEDVAMFEAALAEVEGDIETKLEGYCALIKNLEAEAKAYKALADEMKWLQAKKRTRENAAERLKKHAITCLEAAGLQKMVAGAFRPAVQNNSQPSLVIEDETKVPERFKTRIDEALVKAELEAGIAVPGACLVRGKHLRIY